MTAHGNRCAISTCDLPEASEAAHSFGSLGTKTNVVTHGFLLRGDIHALYDLGLSVVDPTLIMVVTAPRLKAADYGDLAGGAVRLPKKLNIGLIKMR